MSVFDDNAKYWQALDAQEDFIYKLLSNLPEDQLDDLDSIDMSSPEMRAAAKHLKVIQEYGPRGDFDPAAEALKAYAEGDEFKAEALEEDSDYVEPELRLDPLN